MVDGQQQTDDGACLYYKLTNEPNGSVQLEIWTPENLRNHLKLCTNRLYHRVMCPKDVDEMANSVDCSLIRVYTVCPCLPL